MGTRADFYIAKDGKIEVSGWLGSIAWDGYEEGISEEIKNSTTENEFKKSVESFLKERDDATFPKDGWPWPWNDSEITDCTYVFEDSKCVCNGSHEFPDMSELKNVAIGNRSGIIIISGHGK